MTETYQVVSHGHVTDLVKAFGVHAWATDLHDTRDSSGMLYPCLVGRRMQKLFKHQRFKRDIAHRIHTYLEESQQHCRTLDISKGLIAI